MPKRRRKQRPDVPRHVSEPTQYGIILLLAAIPPSLVAVLLTQPPDSQIAWSGVVDSTRWVTRAARQPARITEGVVYLRLEGKDRQIHLSMDQGVDLSHLRAGDHVKVWGYLGMTSKDISPTRIESEGTLLLAHEPPSPTLQAVRRWGFRLSKILVGAGMLTLLYGWWAHRRWARGLTTA